MGERRAQRHHPGEPEGRGPQPPEAQPRASPEPPAGAAGTGGARGRMQRCFSRALGVRSTQRGPQVDPQELQIPGKT